VARLTKNIDSVTEAFIEANAEIRRLGLIINELNEALSPSIVTRDDAIVAEILDGALEVA
jgi:hypothetical protein